MPVKKHKRAKALGSPSRGRAKGEGIAQFSADIRTMRLAGTTLAGIAAWLLATHKLKVSRERVRQVLTRITTPEERAEVEEMNRAPIYCSVCGREGKTTSGLCGAHYDRQKRGADMDAPIKAYSSKPSKCLDCRKRIGPGTGVVRNRQRCPGCYSKWAYYNLPGRREAARVAHYKWLDKRLKSVKFRKRYKQGQSEAGKRYRAKKRAELETLRVVVKKALGNKAALASKRAK